MWQCWILLGTFLAERCHLPCCLWKAGRSKEHCCWFLGCEEGVFDVLLQALRWAARDGLAVGHGVCVCVNSWST